MVGTRKLLRDVIPVVWNDASVLMRSQIAARSPLLRKYLMKLSQRIGLTCLPHRSPAWRYVVGEGLGGLPREEELDRGIRFSAKGGQYCTLLDWGVANGIEVCNDQKCGMGSQGLGFVVRQATHAMCGFSRGVDCEIKWSCLMELDMLEQATHAMCGLSRGVDCGDPYPKAQGRHSTLGGSTSENLSRRIGDTGNHVANVDSSSNPNAGCPQEENMDVPEIVEEIIELLLSGLRDTDTVVRWSAAKGIGRVTSRLTYTLSEEVLSSILELFSPGEGDGSWHGGCMALAELARRGLLLPVSFPKVVPVVVKALHYDIRRGPHSVGSHVRDAAAYVCWAFGRAYYHRDMESILEQLAPHLLTVACYDREVNCRRAAAAAFQENVGRQGNYAHGIEIVNIADYFALSSRVNSYLYVAVCIAQYDGYLRPFVDELVHNKICHWVERHNTYGLDQKPFLSV
ncbi:hypothetical protein U1Q18_023392 [Sarracenia purpurea var. burkii]